MRTVVVIGGVAGGMSAAARLRRLDPSARIIVVEQGSEVSFANCGLPYFLSGEIANRSDLLLRTPESLAATLSLEVRVDTLATAIDPAAREVTVRGPEGREERIGYDALVLAPGAYAVRPPIPGIDHPRVRTLRTVPDADTIRGWVQQGAARAVVLGAGFIGLEAAEALRHAGLDVSIVEAAPHVLPVIDAELAAYVTDELRTHGVNVHEGVAARAILDVEGTPVVELADGSLLIVNRGFVAQGSSLPAPPTGEVQVLGCFISLLELLYRVWRDEGETAGRYEKLINIKDKGQIFRVDVDSIERIEAAGDYMVIYTADNSLILRETMKDLEKRLDPRHFQRIHRSTIVNLNHVRQVKPHTNGECFLVLESGNQVKVSRSYRDVVARFVH